MYHVRSPFELTISLIKLTSRSAPLIAFLHICLGRGAMLASLDISINEREIRLLVIEFYQRDRHKRVCCGE